MGHGAKATSGTKESATRARRPAATTDVFTGVRPSQVLTELVAVRIALVAPLPV